MKDEHERTEEIPVYQEENDKPESPQKPEEPHRSVNWPHIAILLGILAGIVIIILSLTIYIRSSLNAADATDSEPSSEAAASPTPKATQATDFYTGDDAEATASPSASPKSKTSTSDDKDKDKDQDDEVPDDLPQLKSYDNIHLNNGISVTARADNGTFEVVATDQNGNSKVVFNEDGPFDKSDVRTDLGEGTYTIAIYGDATGWSWSYSTY